VLPSMKREPFSKCRSNAPASASRDLLQLTYPQCPTISFITKSELRLFNEPVLISHNGTQLFTLFVASASAALQGKSHLCILFWELRGLSPNFHIHVSVSDLYIPRIGPHTYLPAEEQADRLWGYIHRSQTHEYGNCDCGRAIPFLEISVSNFQNLCFAVWDTNVEYSLT
jgi:hypothetical protein